MYEKKKKMAIVNKSKFQFSSEPTKLPPAISAECVAQPLYSKSSRQPIAQPPQLKTCSPRQCTGVISVGG